MASGRFLLASTRGYAPHGNQRWDTSDFAEETKHLPRSYIDRYLSDIAFHVDYSGLVRVADDCTHYDVIPNLQGKSGTWITEFPDQAPVNLKNRNVKEFPVSFPSLTGYYVTDRESLDESEIAPIEYWAAIIVLSVYYINSPVTYIVPLVSQR